MENWLQGALTQVLSESFCFITRGGEEKKKRKSAPLDSKDTFKNFPHKFELICYLEYFSILFIASEAEPDLGLTLGSRCFLGVDHIYSPKMCAWLLPSLCPAAKPCSLRCALLETLWGISRFPKRQRSCSANRLARILSGRTASAKLPVGAETTRVSGNMRCTHVAAQPGGWKRGAMLLNIGVVSYQMVLNDVLSDVQVRFFFCSRSIQCKNAMDRPLPLLRARGVGEPGSVSPFLLRIVLPPSYHT